MAAVLGRRFKKLIRAAVLSAKGQGEPPPELVMRARARAWGLPPRAGGYGEQDYAEINRMDLLQVIYEAVSAWKAGKASPGQREVVNWLAKEKMMERGNKRG